MCIAGRSDQSDFADQIKKNKLSSVLLNYILDQNRSS